MAHPGVDQRSLASRLLEAEAALSLDVFAPSETKLGTRPIRNAFAAQEKKWPLRYAALLILGCSAVLWAGILLIASHLI
jgi:hypothetical protein